LPLDFNESSSGHSHESAGSVSTETKNYYKYAALHINFSNFTSTPILIT
jgi:hypothetical protein